MEHVWLHSWEGGNGKEREIPIPVGDFKTASSGIDWTSPLSQVRVCQMFVTCVCMLCAQQILTFILHKISKFFSRFYYHPESCTRIMFSVNVWKTFSWNIVWVNCIFWIGEILLTTPYIIQTKGATDYMWLWINLNSFYYPSIVLSFECVVCLLWNWISYISISPLSFLNCHSGFFLFPCIHWKHLSFLKKLHLRFTRSYIILFYSFLFCFCLCFLQGWSTIPISSFMIHTQIAVLWFKVVEAERE